jgi:dienelactone hydrolase
MKTTICAVAIAASCLVSAARAEDWERRFTPELVEDLRIDRNVPVIFDVALPQSTNKSMASGQENPLIVGGRLQVPNTYSAAGSPKAPAVVLVHGSFGLDSREKLYADALNLAGIATLEIDMWAARGYVNGLDGAKTQRPSGVPDTLPDAYGALEFLATKPYIDANRIGIAGFSWGGVVTMLTATKPYTSMYETSGLQFAAHAPNYPVCWVYNVVPGYEFASFTGAPILIQAGALDAYDANPNGTPNPDRCPQLVASLPSADQAFISAIVYPGATHGWDRLEPPVTVTDPFSHSGAGGEVTFVPNQQVAKQSRDRMVLFFKTAFGL